MGVLFFVVTSKADKFVAKARSPLLTPVALKGQGFVSLLTVDAGGGREGNPLTAPLLSRPHRDACQANRFAGLCEGQRPLNDAEVDFCKRNYYQEIACFRTDLEI